MIQDRTMQNLWGAVDELRQRVEELENGGTPLVMELDYVASMTSNRKTFHLRGCKFTEGFIAVEGGYFQFSSHDEALAAGLVPCKRCGA
ncbi:hypothetical protein GBAR_LOCUS29620 [Geodia barretti]|uniref:Uncharacterized protein n=1 Tax=Geodia barretti TaxID=519541 RepID=A0AA35XJ03_GEOBA|nr:hypothetical protein GBAR_LOCUS29620 [Geodia barretti]